MKNKIIISLLVGSLVISLFVLIKKTDNMNVNKLELLNKKINDNLVKQIISVLKTKSDKEAKKLLLDNESIVYHIGSIEKYKLASLDNGFNLLQEKSNSLEIKVLSTLFKSLINFELEDYKKASEKYQSIGKIVHSSKKLSKDEKNILLWRINNKIHRFKQAKLENNQLKRTSNINGIVFSNENIFNSIFKPFKITFSGKIQVNFKINPKLQIDDIMFHFSAKNKNNEQNPEIILQNSQTIIKRKDNSFYISNLAPDLYDFNIRANIKETKNEKSKHPKGIVKKWDLTTFSEEYSPKYQNIYHNLYRKYYSNPITIAPNGNIILNEKINYIKINFPKNISLSKENIISWEMYFLDKYDKKDYQIETFVAPRKKTPEGYIMPYKITHKKNSVVLDKKFLTKECKLSVGDKASFGIKVRDKKTDKLIAYKSRYFTCKP